MTVVPWPVVPWPVATRPLRPRQSRALIVDPLPRALLHSLVADIPGPNGETEAGRAVRFESQLAEVLGFNPRDSVEAMLAVQCVLLRLMAEDARRDAARPGLVLAITKKLPRTAEQFDKSATEMLRTLTERQSRPLGKLDPGIFHAMGLEPPLIADPDDPDLAEEAVSATIVPLHPAPRMRQ